MKSSLFLIFFFMFSGSPVNAALVSWDLSFQDNSGNLVATGQLIYDKGATVCIGECNFIILDDDGNAIDLGLSLQVEDPITSIDIFGTNGNVFPTTSGFFSSASWGGGYPWTYGEFRGGGYYQDTGLEYTPEGPNLSNTTFLMYDFTKISETERSAFWAEGAELELYLGNPNTFLNSGTVSLNLTSVPLPGAFGLFFSVLAPLGFWLSKHRALRASHD